MKLIWKLFLLLIAVCLFIKAQMLNDVHQSFRDDPIEIWIAVGVAYLILDRVFANPSEKD